MKVAAIQMTSCDVIEDNLLQADELIRDAAANGATFIATPEVTDQIIANRAEKISEHFDENNHPGISFFQNLAKELGITLLIGSMCVKVADDKLANRSYLFDPTGSLIATYDKIHLYDVDLPTGESHRESNSFRGGEHAVIAEVEGHKTGLTICYDMRFPHLARHLGQAGAKIIMVPSAFTVPTGKAHWHTLLRARAIETGAFVIAPAQVGNHNGVRVTYGHSLIIDPWGHILAEATEDKPCIITDDLNFDLVQKARQAIPALQHDRDFVDVTVK